MSGDTDWEQTRTAISAHLEPDEPLEGIFTAVLPDEGRGRGFASSGLWPLILAVEYATRRADVRKAGQTAGVPLARRMIIGLTPRRLIIGKADRRWRLREIAGDLPRNQVANVDFGGASPRVRRVFLRLKNGESVTLRMSREVADQLRERLSS